MNITVYLGALKGNDESLEMTHFLKKQCVSWERGLEQMEILLYMAVQNLA